MELTLKRVAFHDDGTIGVLLSGSVPVCLTLEEEWKDNERNISCIPLGSYTCRRVTTPKHGTTYEVAGVPGRSAILFHSGNTEEDTMGCIITGREFGWMTVKDEDSGAERTKLAVLRSREAFSQFMEAVDGKQEFTLHVRAC